MRPAARHGQNFGTLLETVYYDYWGGSARQIVRKAEGDPVWRRTWFQFDGSGRVWMTVQDEWELNTNGTIDEDTLSRSRCTEFRYGASGRHRYLTRALNPETLQPTLCHDGRWSDYFAGGESIYTDYSLTVGDAATNDTPDYVVTNDMTRHMPGAWQSDANTSGTWSTSFIHGDQIDSMRAMTAGGGGGGPGAGAIVQRRVYTAFGESVHESGAIYTRYGYAGAWGYGGGEALWFTGPHPMTLLHVGERLYDPGTGRFLQRDSAGLTGGLNVYSYCAGNPVSYADATGNQAEEIPSLLKMTLRELIIGPPAYTLGRLAACAWVTPIGTLIGWGGALGASAKAGWEAGQYLDRLTHAEEEFTPFEIFIARHVFDDYYGKKWDPPHDRPPVHREDPHRG